MKISELAKQLQDIQSKVGDIEVRHHNIDGENGDTYSDPRIKYGDLGRSGYGPFGFNLIEVNINKADVIIITETYDGGS